jgi:hypothetical protein
VIPFEPAKPIINLIAQPIGNQLLQFRLAHVGSKKLFVKVHALSTLDRKNIYPHINNLRPTSARKIPTKERKYFWGSLFRNFFAR